MDNDLISRQAAISFIENVPYIKSHQNMGDLIKAWLEQIPAVQPEQRAGKWIKCSDKLPENGEPVIVAVYGSDILTVNDNSIESLKKAIEESREIVRYTTLAYYINGDGWYSDGFPMMVTPEYWMLLPEPPGV